MRTPEWGLLHPVGLRHHLRQVARLRRLTRRRAVVVHCARALPEGVGAWLHRGLTGAPYVCWAHGEDIASARSSRELTWLMGRVFRSAGALIANSRNTASLLGEAGAPQGRIDVVHPGVDAMRFRPDLPGASALRERLSAGNPAALLLTVGRLQRRKGHDVMLQALARIDRRATPVRYVIVGDGEERERLERLSADLRLDRCVQFVGVVPASDLPAYYAAADVFVHPNRIDAGDIEGFGIVFLEAAAAGLPVVAGDSGGVPEAVLRDVTGVLVSGTDVSELHDAVTGLIASPERRRVMGAAGRARVVSEFSWERAAARVREIHARVSARAAAPTVKPR
jgi:phosphatidylinositol alpha-1,6-mannosyltransferase